MLTFYKVLNIYTGKKSGMTDSEILTMTISLFFLNSEFFLILLNPYDLHFLQWRYKFYGKMGQYLK